LTHMWVTLKVDSHLNLQVRASVSSSDDSEDSISLAEFIDAIGYFGAG
jgi:hypothetical protein